MLKVSCVPGTMLVTFASRAWHVDKVQNMDHVEFMGWDDKTTSVRNQTVKTLEFVFELAEQTETRVFSALTLKPGAVRCAYNLSSGEEDRSWGVFDTVSFRFMGRSYLKRKRG